MTTKIELGKTYKDKVHGIKGIAVARTTYLTGCDQVGLERIGSDGNVQSAWFDITRLIGVRIAKADKKPGGPQHHAPAKSHG